MGALIAVTFSFAKAAAATLAVPTDYPSITAALQVAADGDRIEVAEGIYTEDLDITDGPAVEIAGAGTDRTVFTQGDGSTLWLLVDTALTLSDLTIDAGGARRCLSVHEGSTVIGRNLALVNGAYGSGAGVHVDGSSRFELYDGLIDGGVDLGGGGGALRIEGGGSALLERVTITDNHASAVGGGIWSAGALTVRGSTFRGNSASYGGQLACVGAGAVCTVEDTVFDAGMAIGGGAVYGEGASITLANSALCSNAAIGTAGLETSAHGGAVFGQDAALTLTNVTLYANTADDRGGAVFVDGGSADLVNNTFLANEATGEGGALAAIDVDASLLHVVNNLVVDNVSAGVAVSTSGANGGYNLFFANVPDDAAPGPLATDVRGDDPGLTDPRRAAPDDPCGAWIPDADGPAIDEGDPALSDPDGTRSDIGATGGPDVARDQDGDGALDGTDPGDDCADRDPAIAPGQPEVCNTLDDDCDGLVDEDCVEPTELDPGGDPGESSTTDRSPRELPTIGAVGCGCASGAAVRAGWIAALAAGIAASRRRRTDRRPVR